MAGIYIHIPFCKKACNYCNFHFSVNQQALPLMVEAIIREAHLQQHYITEPIETIYFGGGTPSLLTNDQLTSIMSTLRDKFVISSNPEVTLEANPDDITAIKLQGWKEAGINRLSIGIQSFFAEDLIWMGRAHSADQALNCIQLAQHAGFTNLSIDLIYGGPTLTDEHWSQNLAKAIELNIPHLSCYALTVEPKTVLAKKINDHILDDVDVEKQSTHFNMLLTKTTEANYEHYEISNFALTGNRSKHNASYWSGKHYLGLGPAAHSFNSVSRQWNIANNNLYIQAIQQGTVPFEIEELTRNQQINEYIMTALRTMEGIDLARLTEIGNEEVVGRLKEEAAPFVKDEKLQHTGNYIRITNKGKFFADGIAAALFQL
jgi:oxygen-independent coproporphyrinogen-3 oxidase